MTTATLQKLVPSDVVAEFLRAADRSEPAIARAIRQAMERLRDRATLAQLAGFVSRRDLRSIEDMFASVLTDSEWESFHHEIERSVMFGAETTAETSGTIPGLQGDFEVRVGLNPRLAQFAETMTSTRIRMIDNTTRETIRQVMRRGTVAGDDPFAVARQIRGSIGLTTRQEQAVANYERELREGRRDALRRELRDRRSDSSIARLLDNDKPIPEDRIQSLVERYRKRFVKHRSEVIGRTESIRAVQGAQWELFQDMIDRGQIAEAQVRRTWIHTGDARVRDSHLAVPMMNPRGVGQNEPFATPLGPLLYPGDPEGTAENTINCRCAVFARIISRELLPGLLTRGAG